MLFGSCLGILVVDVGAENLVLAVLGPGLAYHLKLHISGVAHACFLAGCKGIRICKIFLQRLHLCQVKSKKTLLGKLLQRRIIHRCKIKILDCHIAGNHFIWIEVRKLLSTQIFLLYELSLLHQRVVERFLH